MAVHLNMLVFFFLVSFCKTQWPFDVLSFNSKHRKAANDISLLDLPSKIAPITRVAYCIELIHGHKLASFNYTKSFVVSFICIKYD